MTVYTLEQLDLHFQKLVEHDHNRNIVNRLLNSIPTKVTIIPDCNPTQYNTIHTCISVGCIPLYESLDMQLNVNSLTLKQVLDYNGKSPIHKVELSLEQDRELTDTLCSLEPCISFEQRISNIFGVLSIGFIIIGSRLFLK